MIESWVDAMSLAEEATMADGDALANQEKYEESFNGKLQKLQTRLDTFWIEVMDSAGTDFIISLLTALTGALSALADTFDATVVAITAFVGALMSVGKVKNFLTDIVDDPKKVGAKFKEFFDKVFCPLWV